MHSFKECLKSWRYNFFRFASKTHDDIITLEKATDPIQPAIQQAAVAGACAAAAALRAHHRGGRIPAAAAGGVRFLEFGGEGGGDANDNDGDDIDRGWETALDTYEGADFGVQVDLAAAMS